ncbi:5'-3' exonuclease, putative [Babesia caballi]|uniref:5'-3' exonuclease, putative n=1 Tax=Babesia caballi TaxID=5871 RepID=A0AAV4LUJ1_BABCB|nr:5'-3' exonuclease, putative [Babesia caballi]
MKPPPLSRTAAALCASALCICLWISGSAAALHRHGGGLWPPGPPRASCAFGCDVSPFDGLYNPVSTETLARTRREWDSARLRVARRYTPGRLRSAGRISPGFLASEPLDSPAVRRAASSRQKRAKIAQHAAGSVGVQAKHAATNTLRDRVLLVDGTGLAYRCFFALPTLTTYRGTEIGAIVGFMNSLARIYKSFGPKYVGIAFDSPGANSSKREVWPEYKANRQAIKTSFKKQLMWIKEFCAIVGLPIFLKRSTEADDIIASMITFLGGGVGSDAAAGSEEVQRLKQLDFRVPEPTSGGVFDRVYDRVSGAATARLEPVDSSSDTGVARRSFEVHVLTADKDLLQVLEHNTAGNLSVRVVQPHKQFRLVDEEMVLQEYGIPPGRFSEYLALVGDAADNIPGVMGVGPKTAPVLISKYGSFQEIIESEEIAKIARRSGKHSKSVERAYDFHLITKLRGDVPVLSSLGQLRKKRTLERQFVAFCRMFSLQKCSLRWHDVTH